MSGCASRYSAAVTISATPALLSAPRSVIPEAVTMSSPMRSRSGAQSAMRRMASGASGRARSRPSYLRWTIGFTPAPLTSGDVSTCAMKPMTGTAFGDVGGIVAVTAALASGNRASAEKMLDADFSWIDPDGVYYATKGEAFAAGVKPVVATGSDVKVLEHRYGKVVYVERSEADQKFSGHFWVQRPNG